MFVHTLIRPRNLVSLDWRLGLTLRDPLRGQYFISEQLTSAHHVDHYFQAEGKKFRIDASLKRSRIIVNKAHEKMAQEKKMMVSFTFVPCIMLFC